MNKFKLIKKYPKSPPIGTIVEVSSDGYCSYQMSDDYHKLSTHLHKDVIKDYNEFWEEVIKKDYEIISFKQRGGVTDLWTRFGTNNWCRNSNGKPITNPYTYDEIIKSNLYRINSVKRLSDGEIFTVGDKIRGHKLEEIFIAPSNKNDLVLSCEGLKRALYLIEDSHLKIDRNPLFTTEDGVDIYEGDDYFELITPNFHNKPCIWNILPYKVRPNIIYDQEGNRKNGRIWFSTKESAEEYVLMNKPCLSINDVLLSVDGALFLEKTLKRLVKQKLNK